MNNMTKHISFLSALVMCCLVLGFSSCSLFQQHSKDGIVAQVAGEQLALTDLDQITAGAATEQDSVIIAEQYIRQWASEILMYQKAKDRPISHLEALVEDYRNSLYVHDYEQQLVARKMSHFVHDTVIADFYDKHSDQFILRENIVKGVLLVFPKDAPHQKELHQWLTGLDVDDNVESIEKYAYQYATGYEWFTDNWKTANQILLRLPTQQTDVLNEQLRTRTNCIEIADSMSVYLLQVTDRHLFGEPMPMDYAAPEIKQIILGERQVDFLKQQKRELYDEAVRFGKVKLFKRENK